MGFLSGKRALIVGLASKRSIAYGIAEAMAREGAELAFTYQNDKLKGRVEDMAGSFGSSLTTELDVTSDDAVKATFDYLADTWDRLDVVVHSVGFAPGDQLSGRYVEAVTREGFAIAHDISAYSFSALAKAAQPLMANSESGALLTLSYLGAIRAIPNYNVMGLAKASLEASVRFLAADLGADNIRVNGISAGPIKTLAASGVGGIRKMLSHVEERAPIKRNVTIQDVGNAAAFLCSDLAAGITGEILYVDGGYSHIGMSLD